MHTSRWQKIFRPTLLSWAATWPDPYSTNTQLDEDVVLEMWDLIYYDIELDTPERQETGVKLLHLVRLLDLFLRPTVHFPFQAGNMLHDWRTAIGTGALNVVKAHFLNPANDFTKDRIVSFVKWATHPTDFPFIFGEPDGEEVSGVNKSDI